MRLTRCCRASLGQRLLAAMIEADAGASTAQRLVLVTARRRVVTLAADLACPPSSAATAGRLTAHRHRSAPPLRPAVVADTLRAVTVLRAALDGNAVHLELSRGGPLSVAPVGPAELCCFAGLPAAGPPHAGTLRIGAPMLALR